VHRINSPCLINGFTAAEISKPRGTSGAMQCKSIANPLLISKRLSKNNQIAANLHIFFANTGVTRTAGAHQLSATALL
jgi:hypothetical protein